MKKPPALQAAFFNVCLETEREGNKKGRAPPEAASFHLPQIAQREKLFLVV
jgi:hypothetical protein